MNATRALLDKARKRLSVEDVRQYVGPNDPGWPDYLGQMLAVRKEGAAALTGYLDSDPLFDALFDVDGPYPSSFLWYRLMAASAALLCDNDLMEMNSNYYLARILADCARLRTLGDQEAPVELTPAICREEAKKFTSWSPENQLFALLGELVAARLTGAPDERVVELCNRFDELEQALGHEYRTPEYLWGLTDFDAFHFLWLKLVHRYVPTHVKEAAAIRELLLEHGGRWEAPETKETPIDDTATGNVHRPLSPWQIAVALKARTKRGQEVALQTAEDLLDTRPDPSDDAFKGWLSVMNNTIHLAHANRDFQRAARFADAAKGYAQLNRFLPHNLACAFAAVSRKADAIEMCAVAIETGSTDFATLKNDDDLGGLRSDQRFKALNPKPRKPGRK